MIKRLSEPYPLPAISKRLQIALFVSLFVFIFLVILEPFDLNLLETRHKTLKIAGYGIVCLFGLLFFYILPPKVFIKIFDDSNWTLSNELVWLLTNILLIGILLSVYESTICTCSFSFHALSAIIFKSLTIGLLPIALITLVNQNYQLRENLNKAQTASFSLKNIKKENVQRPGLVVIQSDISETLTLNPMNIIMAQAEDNYTTFYLDDTDQVKKHLLRITLKNSETQLSFPFISRCHRSYLVNLLKIDSVKGNAGGYRLKLYDIEKEIPVSRQNTKKILHRIRKLEKDSGSEGQFF